jgi:hypothetical protein
MQDMGFPLDGDLKARNGNAYILGNFQYASAFSRSEALRPTIKVEITAFDPISRVEMRPLRTILDRILDNPAQTDVAMVPVVSIEDTLADKVVGYLRRTAADRAGCGRGSYDDRLVRHLYDVHQILQARGDLSDVVGTLFADTLERDRETYGNQFPEFKEDPFAVLQDEIGHLFDKVARDRYEQFCQSMIYGDIPSFDDAATRFERFSTALMGYALSKRVTLVQDAVADSATNSSADTVGFGAPTYMGGHVFSVDIPEQNSKAAVVLSEYRDSVEVSYLVLDPAEWARIAPVAKNIMNDTLKSEGLPIGQWQAGSNRIRGDLGDALRKMIRPNQTAHEESCELDMRQEFDG